MKRLAACLACSAALVLAAPALASEQHPTLAELEGEVMCLVCSTTLDQSHSPFADRERVLIRRWIAAGHTKSEIKQKLVDEYGEAILAAPPKSGFNLLAWVLPIAGVVAGAVVLGFLAWWWSRSRREDQAAKPSGGSRLDPELERRLDDELARFDA